VRYSIYASRETWASASSKELLRVDAEDEQERLQAEDDLWNDGFEINDVREIDDEQPTARRRNRRR